MSHAQLALLLMDVTFAILASAVALAAVAVSVLLFLRLRSLKQEAESRARKELADKESEAMFIAAVEQASDFETAARAAQTIGVLLWDHLWLPALAVYAGREGAATLTNILPAESTSNRAALPASLKASVAKLYSRPSLVRLGTIAHWEAGRARVADSGDAFEETTRIEPESFSDEDGTVSSDSVEAERGTSNEYSPASDGASPDVFVLPWHGPLSWSGLIVAGTRGGMTAEELERYREPLARMTDRLAAALEIETENERLRALDERVSRTAEFSRALIASLDGPTPLVSIAREAARLVGADSAALWRREQESLMIRMVASHGLKSAEFLPLPVGQGLAGTVAGTGQSLAIEDAPADSRCIFPREARESGIAAYLGAAIESDGDVIAVLEVHKAGPHAWTGDQQRSLEAAATIAAELVKSSDARGDRLKVESAYLGLSEALQRLRSREDILEAAVEVLGHALGVSRALFIEFDENGRAQAVKQEYHQESVKSVLGATFAEGLAERVIAAGANPISISDSREDPLAGARAAAEFQILSELALPVTLNGATRATVYVHQCDRLREWQSDEIEFADRVARQLSLSLSNLQAFDATRAEVEAAQEDARKARETAAAASEFQEKISELEREIGITRNGENQARAMLAHASALEATARAEADLARRAEAEAHQEVERLAADCVRAQNSSQQLLEINRLKSEFIVNAGREIDASLQSVLGLAEMLEQGAFGRLGPEQMEAVRGIYNWGKRVKSDVDWLIDYGSARSRRLEPSSE